MSALNRIITLGIAILFFIAVGFYSFRSGFDEGQIAALKGDQRYKMTVTYQYKDIKVDTEYVSRVDSGRVWVRAPRAKKVINCTGDFTIFSYKIEGRLIKEYTRRTITVNRLVPVDTTYQRIK
jgi:hypothetical protein